MKIDIRGDRFMTKLRIDRSAEESHPQIGETSELLEKMPMGITAPAADRGEFIIEGQNP